VKEEAETADRQQPTSDMKVKSPNETPWLNNRYAAGASGYGTSAGGKRNLRNFWLLGPEPFPEAHFATFPSEIPRICIKAGTSERGVCSKCGAPWERVVAKSMSWSRPKRAGRTDSLYDGKGHVSDQVREGHDIRNGVLPSSETIGWQPTCRCDAGDPVPATVLDPFLGSGTTALVADQLQRDCIGIELSPAYAEMARSRIRKDNSLFSSVAAE
jgi:hypothetical protein